MKEPDAREKQMVEEITVLNTDGPALDRLDEAELERAAGGGCPNNCELFNYN
jgi:hypothetical protein